MERPTSQRWFSSTVKCGLIIIDNPSMDPGYSDYLERLKSNLKRKIFKCQSEDWVRPCFNIFTQVVAAKGQWRESSRWIPHKYIEAFIETFINPLKTLWHFAIIRKLKFPQNSPFRGWKSKLRKTTYDPDYN